MFRTQKGPAKPKQQPCLDYNHLITWILRVVADVWSSSLSVVSVGVAFRPCLCVLALYWCDIVVTIIAHLGYQGGWGLTHDHAHDHMIPVSSSQAAGFVPKRKRSRLQEGGEGAPQRRVQSAW